MSVANEEPRTQFVYDEWMAAQHVPIYRGYFVPDIRKIELGLWQERGCQTAFIQLVGQEGASEARVTEIAPGDVLPPYKMSIEELVYVAQGNGTPTVWVDCTRPPGGRRADRAHTAGGLTHELPHVGLRRPHLQEGAPARPGTGHRGPVRRGL